MTPKTDLHELIHSLTKGEIKAFRNEVLSRKGKHVYLKLFDAILAMDIYDEAALKGQLTGEKTLNNFSIAKSNLYEKLMEVLCTLPYHFTIETRFDRFRQEIAILIRKSLYKQAMGRVRKAIRLAEKLEAYNKILDLHDLQREIARNFLPPQIYLDLLKELRNREAWLREMEDNIAQYKSIFNTASIAQKVPRKIRMSMISGILNHPIMQDESECRSVTARLYFYRIWNHLYFVQGKDSGWKFFTEKIIDLLEGHQHLLSDPGKFLVYINNISDFALNAIAAGEFANALEAAEKLLKIRKNLKAGDNEAMIFTRYWKIQLLYCQKILDKRNGLNAVDQIREGLRRFQGKISKSDAMELQHIVATFLLNIERSSDAISWILELRDDRPSVRPDLHYFSWILFLVAHFNLGHMDVIEQQIPGTLNYLRQQKTYSDFYKICVTFFRKAVLTRGSKELKNGLQAFREKLLDWFRESGNTGSLRYFQMIAWIDARLAGIPMHEQLKLTPEFELPEE